MKIVTHLNVNCRYSRNVRAIMEKYNLYYEEHDDARIQSLYAQKTQSSNTRLLPCVAINGIELTDISGKDVQKHLLEKGLIETVDRKPRKILHTDEEQEAMRSKTIRFF